MIPRARKDVPNPHWLDNMTDARHSLVNNMTDAAAEHYCAEEITNHTYSLGFRGHPHNPQQWYQIAQLTEEIETTDRTYRFTEFGWLHSYLEHEEFDERTLPSIIPDNPHYISEWDRDRTFY